MDGGVLIVLPNPTGLAGVAVVSEIIMQRKKVEKLARVAGFVLGQMYIPKKCYTLTDLTTRKKYRMIVSLADIEKILQREVEIRKK